ELSETLLPTRAQGTVDPGALAKLFPRGMPRLILLIDDLDRCPPEKVVDVLQAVHLLLYFPLFIVVVAVDARWLSRSLKDQYPDLLEENVTLAREVADVAVRQDRSEGASLPEEGGLSYGSAHFDGSKGTVTGAGRAASSQDYLEKIFQIPYWVRPMEGEASKAYVRKIVAADVRKPAQGGTSELRQAGGETTLRSGTSPGVVETETTTAEPSDDGGEAPPAVETERSSAPPPSTDGDQQDGQEESGRTDREVTAEDAEFIAESMFLTEHESRFMEALAPYVGRSPRRGLRFANVYRLVKTSLGRTQLQSLVGLGGRSLSYRALLTHLAIVTGAPRIAHNYFQTLLENNNPQLTLGDLRATMEADNRLTEPEERWSLIGALQLIQDLNDEDGINTGVEMISALRLFAPIAMRYSFTARPH
ncbi:MAG: P-loop NTPase fold protein, partial [Alphaproteobacteria bacterium]